MAREYSFSAAVLAALLCVGVGSCSSEPGNGTGGGDGGVDSCAGQTCSGHGTCQVNGMNAVCDCETGYVASGLACVAGGATGTTACNDGIDNDGDASLSGGGIDYPADLGCWGPDDNDEGFPNDATTGPYSTGTTLRGQCATLCTSGLVPSGSVTTTASGMTIQCLDLTGDSIITVNRSDTTVRCVQGISGGVKRRIIVTGSPNNVVIEDSHFSLGGGGGGDPQNMDGIYIADGTNIRVERNEVSEYGDGITIGSPQRLTLRDNWVHGAGSTGNFVGSHADSIEMDGGLSNVVIEGNTLENLLSQTSMLMLDNYGGASDNVTIRRNQMVGASNWPGYTIYCDGTQNSSAMTHHVITANMVQQSVGWPADWDWLVADGQCAGNVIVSANRNRVAGSLYAVYSAVFGGGDTAQAAPNACNDGIDNDGDGKIDWGLSAWNDPDCVNGAGTSE